MRPFFSIILPTYNQSSFLKKSINSVLTQTFENWELIIIDNFSDDETENVIKKYDDIRIKYFKFNNNKNIAKSRNFGIKKAVSDWISFIDSDDVWFKDKLKITKKYIEKKNADFYFHDLNFLNKRVFFYRKKISDKSQSLIKPYMKHFAYYGNGIGQSSVTVKKDLLAKINFISENKKKFSWEDFDTWLKLSKLNIEIFRIPKVLASIWVGKDNVTNTKQDILNTINIKKYYNNQFKKYLDPKDKNKKIWWLEYPIIINYFKNKKFYKTTKRIKNLTKSPSKIYIRLFFMLIISKFFILVKNFLNFFNFILIFKKNIKCEINDLDLNQEYKSTKNENIEKLVFSNFKVPKNFIYRSKNNDILHYLQQGEKLLCYGWSSCKKKFYVSEKKFEINYSNSQIFYDFNTIIEYRNKGYYQRLLKRMLKNYPKQNCYIYSTISNRRSITSILKSGFNLYKIVIFSKKIFL